MKAVIEDCKKLRKLCLVLKKERSRSGRCPKTMIRTNGDRGCLELVATDLDTTKILRLPAMIEEPGCAVVDIMDLDKYAKNIKKVGGQLTLETEESGWLQVNHEKLETRLVGVRPEEFPDIVEPDDRFDGPVDLDGGEFFRVIDACYDAIFTGDNGRKQNLIGLYLDGDDVVATDGHRMQCRKLDTGFDQKIVPYSTIKVARYAFKKYKPERVRMQESDDHVAIHIGDHTITSRCIDGTYPDYMQVMPDGDEGTMVRVDRSDVLQALDLLEPTISSKTSNVRLTASDGELELYASDPESGEAKAPIAAETDGPSVKAGVNADYLDDALESFEDDSVTLAVIDTLKPIIIREDSRPDECAVVMPMRL